MLNSLKISLVLFVICYFFSQSRAVAQGAMYHVDHEPLYELVDELANSHLIDVNSAVKPYSRGMIAGWLVQALDSERLTVRQRREVEFYLKEFRRELMPHDRSNKRFDLFYYADSLFSLTANVIAGIEVRRYGSTNVFHRFNGGELYGNIGSNISYYGSLRDNYENKQMAGKEILSMQRGAVYKGYYKKSDYSEARGGISYNWKWGSVGLHKDHVVWGNNYHGANILSGHQPSTTFISIKAKPVKWLEYNYIHSWLVSEVVDSVRSYGSGYEGKREVFVDKYLAASIFTITPVKNLNVSLGNSIIYADTRFNPSYLIPFLFYKSTDHTYNGSKNNIGHNSQMFFDISSRQIRNVHLFTSVFIDEIYIGQMLNKEKQSNFLSFKLGGRYSNLLPNLSITGEYTRNNPLVYTHIYPSTTFESNGYNLGHYLKDNSEEIYVALGYKPIRNLHVKLSHTFARKGEEYQKVIDGNDFSSHPEINLDEPRWGLPFIKETFWKSSSTELAINYQLINDLFIFVKAQHCKISGSKASVYSLPYELADKNSVWFGINFGY
jgi:hypothetical protein